MSTEDTYRLAVPTFEQREAARDAAIAAVALSLPPDMRERIRREVDAAPPLTAQQRDTVATLLDGYVPARRTRRHHAFIGTGRGDAT